MENPWEWKGTTEASADPNSKFSPTLTSILTQSCHYWFDIMSSPYLQTQFSTKLEWASIFKIILTNQGLKL